MVNLNRPGLVRLSEYYNLWNELDIFQIGDII